MYIMLDASFFVSYMCDHVDNLAYNAYHVI